MTRPARPPLPPGLVPAGAQSQISREHARSAQRAHGLAHRDEYARETGLVDKLAPHDLRSYAECRIPMGISGVGDQPTGKPG
jgi:hypothetical protein